MGEAKRKSRHRSEILAAETRCIYCAAKPATVEHMPPRGMFRERRRLSGLEFACCQDCNLGTRAADLIAAFMSRLAPTNDVSDWRMAEAYNLIGGIAKLAPDVIREIFGGRQGRKWMRQPSSVIEPVQLIHADGPTLKELMTVFTAKLGMALFREHVGAPLPLEGGVYTQFYFNYGLNRDVADKILAIMPIHQTLIQGRVHANEQFGYRYNCDDKTILAALAGFHGSLHVRAFAMEDPKPYEFLLGEYNVDLVKPGELTERVAAVTGR